MQKCKNCSSSDLINRPTCDKCTGEVKIYFHECSCGSKEYITKFRTIQVKSSRIEFKDGKSKNTYATDHKPRDMIKSPEHFFIWCLIDEKDKPNFLVMSVDDFIKTMGDSMKGISFLKDQDRQHFSSINFGKWAKSQNAFDKLE